MKLSVIVPTYNEAPNIQELVHRIATICSDIEAEIIFVDDSTDSTPTTIQQAAAISALPVRMFHRQEPIGGLSGAVIEGITASHADYCLVMDGDLQHPPEMIPVMLAQLENSASDVAIASRYCGEGSSNAGLSGTYRRMVSKASTMVTRSLFPVRLKGCSDPMTGFFAIRRTSIDVAALRPTGFKILLEILARQPLKIVEIPFIFGQRFAGSSKATMSQGLRFIRQVGELRVGRIGLFAVVGAIGTVLNLSIMATLLMFGTHYVVAAIAAAELTILTNFLMQERLVFKRARHSAASTRTRFLQSVGFNNAEALLRLPVLVFLVEILLINSVVAQAGTLAAAFGLRYLFHTKVVYLARPQIEPAVEDAISKGPALSRPDSEKLSPAQP
ncbi:glycosyltransferase family 2 protein [Arthrobacter sp. H20]|uniref:glycosyltransferase n=1 Tax=Arthrobacter sp. H20 TaxID=1267981 RepID=UPI000478ED2C|nr:glycosyltransferase family 2 protein [Arthrobacter sp. H20]